MSLAKELTDELNMQAFEECKTKADREIWFSEHGRVLFVLGSLRKRGLLKETPKDFDIINQKRTLTFSQKLP